MGKLVKTCIYTICKNEIKYIKRFLKNTKDADYVVLLDTGSTDGTYECLKKEALKDNRLIISQKIYPYFRFDEARNDSLDLIPSDTDLCIKLDVDEYLSKGWRDEIEKAFDSSISIYNFRYIEKARKRIIKNTRSIGAHLFKERWQWRYPVHEILTSSQNTSVHKSQNLDNIFVFHTPKKGTFNKKKVCFYRELINLRYKENSEETFSIFYLLYDEFQKASSNKEVIKKLTIALLENEDALILEEISNLIRCCFFFCENTLSFTQHEALKEILKILNLKQLDFFNKLRLKRNLRLLKNCDSLEYLGLNKFLKPSSFKKRYSDFHILREQYEGIQYLLQKEKEKLFRASDTSGNSFLKAREKILAAALKKNEELSLMMRSLETTTPLKRLPLEVMLVDHCNLNCAGCNHFAPLAKPHYYKIEEYKRDLKRLKKLYHGKIWDVKLMGGEPLLHPEILLFIKNTRNIFPRAQISILTNGLLLPNQSEDFWKSLKKYKVTLYVTDYKDTPLDKISNLAEYYKIDFRYYPDSENKGVEKKLFSKFCVNLWGDTDIFSKFLDCGNANKTLTLRDGVLYTCPFKATFPFFKGEFNVDIPVVDEGINIYEAKTSKELSEFLCHPTNLCNYCLGECKLVPWNYTNKEMSEWLPDKDCSPKYEKNPILNGIFMKDKE